MYTILKKCTQKKEVHTFSKLEYKQFMQGIIIYYLRVVKYSQVNKTISYRSIENKGFNSQ